MGQQPTFATSPGDISAATGATPHHARDIIGSVNGLIDPAVKSQTDQEIGSNEVVARMHGVQKIPYMTLGAMLADLGVDLSNSDPNSAGAIWRGGQSALGVAIYSSRVPEQIIPTTAALSKQFDIFTAAAPEVIAKVSMSKRCPGVVLIANNLLTLDGISCLVGKQASQDHVTIANSLVMTAPDPATGQKLAVAALLAAAHTSE